jgi:hypothetical protein
MTSMPGSKSRIKDELTRASIVLGKHLCRRSWIAGNDKQLERFAIVSSFGSHSRAERVTSVA